MIDDYGVVPNAKCPRCGFVHFIGWADVNDFPADDVAANGSYLPVMCPACDALPLELLEVREDQE